MAGCMDPGAVVFPPDNTIIALFFKAAFLGWLSTLVLAMIHLLIARPLVGLYRFLRERKRGGGEEA